VPFPDITHHLNNMKQTIFFGVFCSVLAVIPASAKVDCLQLSLSVKHAVAAEQSKVLEIVATEVSATPGCACEIVKAAIEGSSAKPATVAAIVETAATAAPEHLRLISQCAVAVAPDALAQVQAVLAKLDPNRGKSGSNAKSAKDAKAPAAEVAAIPNPLDFPGQGPSGPIGGGPGGQPLMPIFPPIIINPPIINPPDVTDVDPGNPEETSGLR
jgi:hypothetical protein